MTRFRVKVCGITRPQDAILAAQLGADLIGVIFHPASPRVVTLRQAESIVEAASPVLRRVGVFVSESITMILKTAKHLNLDFVQLHGAQSDRDIHRLQDAGVKVIRCVDGSTQSVAASDADIIMLDNMTNGRPGGTGEPFTWPTRPRHRLPNLMLAGGLNEYNIAEGVRLFQPLIIDVNSGVESSPGIKSRAKLTRFMQECDRIRYGN